MRTQFSLRTSSRIKAPAWHLPLAALAALLLILPLLHQALAEPTGATVVSNVTETAPVANAGSSTTAGGSFTTLILNATSQTQRWKAYVGNASGSLSLDDPDGNTIYDWGTASTTGQVYASRSANVDWDAIRCAANSTITAEHAEMNMTATTVENINKTFNTSIHADFFVGTRYFQESECRAIATFVNDQRQAPSVNADFQEVLLDDTSFLIYAALLENALAGFDDGQYDFQMIVPESDVQATPHTYYFYTEFR